MDTISRSNEKYERTYIGAGNQGKSSACNPAPDVDFWSGRDGDYQGRRDRGEVVDNGDEPWDYDAWLKDTQRLQQFSKQEKMGIKDMVGDLLQIGGLFAAGCAIYPLNVPLMAGSIVVLLGSLKL